MQKEDRNGYGNDGSVETAPWNTKTQALPVSVIIPAYNAAQCVTRALDSVLAQTLLPREILIIDDGSQDDTAQIVTAYIESIHASRNGIPSMRLLRQANGGPGAARNRGARVAQGEWLALLDADDVWEPEKLARQWPLTEDTTVGAVMCWERPNADGSAGDEALQYVDFALLWQGNRAVTSTVMLRKQAFEEVGGFDEDRALIGVEDYNLWLRLAVSRWRLARCEGRLYRYAPAPNSLMSQVERMVQAELANVDAIAPRQRLPKAQVREKRQRIYTQYGRDLLYTRDLAGARRLLRQAFRQRPSARCLLWWMAASLPALLLNRRRQHTQKVGK